jgi:hypothetical protein
MRQDRGNVRKPHKKPPERAAWQEGRDAAAAGRQRHDRPNYLTHEEREAFSAGYDDWWPDGVEVRYYGFE